MVFLIQNDTPHCERRINSSLNVLYIKVMMSSVTDAVRELLAISCLRQHSFAKLATISSLQLVRANKSLDILIVLHLDVHRVIGLSINVCCLQPDFGFGITYFL